MSLDVIRLVGFGDRRRGGVGLPEVPGVGGDELRGAEECPARSQTAGPFQESGRHPGEAPKKCLIPPAEQLEEKVSRAEEQQAEAFAEGRGCFHGGVFSTPPSIPDPPRGALIDKLDADHRVSQSRRPRELSRGKRSRPGRAFHVDPNYCAEGLGSWILTPSS